MSMTVQQVYRNWLSQMNTIAQYLLWPRTMKWTKKVLGLVFLLPLLPVAKIVLTPFLLNAFCFLLIRNLICLKQLTLPQGNTNPVNYWLFDVKICLHNSRICLNLYHNHANSNHQLWMSECKPAISPDTSSDTRFKDWHIKMMFSRPCAYFPLTCAPNVVIL